MLTTRRAVNAEVALLATARFVVVVDASLVNVALPSIGANMNAPFILVAGATGDLGGRIAAALVGRGATVRALARNQSKPADRDWLTALGVTVVPAELSDLSTP